MSACLDQSPTDHWLTPQFFDDPYPFYEQLRAVEKLHWSEKLNGWVVLDYEDVNAILRNPRLFSSAGRQAALLDALPQDQRGEFTAIYNHFSVGLIRSDPPDHTRQRALISKVFTPRSVETLRQRVTQLTIELLDEIAAKKQAVDLVAEFAYPLPAMVICEMLGVPVCDRDQVRSWSEQISAIIAGALPIRQAAEVTLKAIREVRAYYAELIDQRRREPCDDLLGLLVNAEENGDRLSMDELLSTAENLLAAGHETTSSLIGSGTYLLLKHPRQLQHLKNNGDLIPAAIEEMLRYESPVQRQTRVVTQDTEFHGRQMRRGQIVFLMLGAANRDPAVFDRPAEFEPQRAENRHLAFGTGVHFCIGAPLARLEATRAFDAMLSRFPNLRLAADPVQWKSSAAIRGLSALPVYLN